MNFQGNRKALMTVGIALFCALVVIAFSGNSLLVDLEHKVQDHWFKLRGKTTPDPKIILIDIDDESIEKIGRWPWDRTVHAKMIQILSESGASIIGYDILFNQKGGEKEDKALSEAIKMAGNVYLPTGFELEGHNDQGLLRVKREVGPISILRDVAAGVGHISSNRDPDGIIRRVPLLVQSKGENIPAFSLAMLAGKMEIPIHTMIIHPGENITLEKENKIIPIDENGMMRINYAGKWVETFNHFSFSELLEGWDTKEGRGQIKEALGGKICLISNTATGYDLKPIPFEKDFPGGGIHANILNTLITDQYLSEIDLGFQISIILIAALLIAGITLITPWGIGLALVLLLSIFYLFTSFYAFQNGLIIPTLPPVFALAFSFLLTLVYQNRTIHQQVDKLSQERTQIGSALLKLTESLRDRENHLNENRKELSQLRYEMETIQGQSQEKVSRIQQLETSLDEAAVEKGDLLRKKRLLEEKVSDLLLEPTPQGVKAEFRELQQECAHFGIITKNKEMLQLFDRAKRTSKAKNPVLIQGGSGTGKELFAWAVHKMSPRSKMPYVTVNIPGLQDNLIESELFGHVKGAFTGAISDRKGLFQTANGGTIFLDEIGEMKNELQAKLLRVLQNGEVYKVGSNSPTPADVRVIAATNRDLAEEVKKGNFREDLYYRLNVLFLNLPPLQERPDDIEILIDYFIKKHALELGRRFEGLTVKAMECLKAHPWNGNVRELENAITRGVALATGNRITESDLELQGQGMFPAEKNFPEEVDQFIKEDGPLSDDDFIAVLRKNSFEIREASRILNVTRGTVASRFKGVCFKILVQRGNDFSLAAQFISGDGRDSAMVERKIRGYYENLLGVIQGFENSEEALEECRRRFKNLPKIYFRSIEKLVKRIFEHVETKG